MVAAHHIPDSDLLPMKRIHEDRTTGCLWSIVLSVVLTILLNVGLSMCSGGAGW